MAGSASRGIKTPPGAKPLGSQKSLVRHVSFNESTLRPPSHLGDIEAQRDQEKQGQKRNARCNMCCAWTSILIGTLSFIILLGGLIFFLFLKSNLPEFHVQTLNVRKLEINTKDQLLDVDIEIGLNATNKNTKVELSYSPMTVETAADNIYLGKVHLSGFNQKPHDYSELKLRNVRRAPVAAPVSESDVNKLKKDLQSHRLVIDVNVEGTITWIVSGYTISRFPFRVYCHRIDELQVENENLPNCQVKLTPVS